MRTTISKMMFILVVGLMSLLILVGSVNLFSSFIDGIMETPENDPIGVTGYLPSLKSLIGMIGILVIIGLVISSTFFLFSW